jgi:hypothetical protein
MHGRGREGVGDPLLTEIQEEPRPSLDLDLAAGCGPLRRDGRGRPIDGFEHDALLPVCLAGPAEALGRDGARLDASRGDLESVLREDHVDGARLLLEIQCQAVGQHAQALAEETREPVDVARRARLEALG